MLNFFAGFDYNMGVRFRYLILLFLTLGLAGVAVAQNGQPAERLPVDQNAPPPKDNTAEPPRHDNGESSSKETQIDISPPKNDSKDHPNSYEVDTESDVEEFTPYNPMKAMKDIEVGDWYYKQENYKAAISRYQEALQYKPRDAEATYKLGEVLEKTGDYAGAVQNYRDYLKILPHGPYAQKAEKKLDHLKDKVSPSSAKAASPAE